MLLIELATYLIIDALISPYKIGERLRARKLLRSVGEGMLLTWDRGLHSFKLADGFNSWHEKVPRLTGRLRLIA